MASIEGLEDGGGREVVEVVDGGEDAAVAELPRDDGDVDAFGAELGGVGVAEAVGVDALGDAGASSERGEHAADGGGGDGATGPRAEERRGGGRAERFAVAEPFVEEAESAGVDADGARVAAFGEEDADGAGVGVDVVRAERECFAEAEPGAVEERDECAGASAEGGMAAGSVEERADL